MSTDIKPPSLHVNRTVAATPEQVFEAWTSVDLLRSWFAPAPAHVAHAAVDLRVGGAYTIVMEAPDGTKYTAHGTYREIDPPNRLVFTFDWQEEVHTMDAETVVTVTMTPTDEGTRVDIAHTGFPTAEQAAGHDEGWTVCLEQLAAVDLG